VGVDERREASGLLVRDDLSLVVCDNTGLVAILDPGLALPGPTGRSHYAVEGGWSSTRRSGLRPRPLPVRYRAPAGWVSTASSGR
jgi:hypothetical protein